MKPNIAVLTGGYSGEAEIARKSAQTVMMNLDKNKYNLYLIDISRKGWFYISAEGKSFEIDKNNFTLDLNGDVVEFNCAFIVIHGTPGEDGKLQAYFDMIGIPYTGCGFHTSVATFNKATCKSIVKEHGINVAGSFVVRKGSIPSTSEVLSRITLPCFIKPNNGGSSIGISRVNHENKLQEAIQIALSEDSEIIIEDFIEGIEVTCGVALLNGQITALGVTEIVSKNEFFDYEAKYKGELNEEITPARLPEEKLNECKDISSKIFDILECKGVVRIDFILKENDFFMIEVNTIPGISAESILPKQSKASGIPLKELFDQCLFPVLNL